jgi:hypothetical protein
VYNVALLHHYDTEGVFITLWSLLAPDILASFTYCEHFGLFHTLWNTIFSRVGLAWVMPRRVANLFAC